LLLTALQLFGINCIEPSRVHHHFKLASLVKSADLDFHSRLVAGRIH